MEKLEKEDQLVKHEVWDCGSSLYDSFELKSLQHQLHSAISARTMSMPHLSHHRQPRLHRQKPPNKRYSRMIPRSLHRLLRSVFRPKQNYYHGNNNNNDNDNSFSSFYVYDTSTALSTIPEKLPEFDGFSPELPENLPEKSLVTRAQSDRFMSSSVISCV